MMDPAQEAAATLFIEPRNRTVFARIVQQAIDAATADEKNATRVWINMAKEKDARIANLERVVEAARKADAVDVIDIEFPEGKAVADALAALDKETP